MDSRPRRRPGRPHRIAAGLDRRAARNPSATCRRRPPRSGWASLGRRHAAAATRRRWPVPAGRCTRWATHRKAASRRAGWTRPTPRSAPSCSRACPRPATRTPRPSPGRTARCAGRACACASARRPDEARPRRDRLAALRHQPRAEVEAPMLVIEVQPGAQLRAGRDARTRSRARRRMPARAGAEPAPAPAPGRRRHAAAPAHRAPGAQDRIAHHVHARLGRGARYHQALLASGSGYHLQRSAIELHGEQAEAAPPACCWPKSGARAAGAGAHGARTPPARSTCWRWAAAARASWPTRTRASPRCRRGRVRQRLSGIPTGRPAAAGAAPAPGDPPRPGAGRTRRHLGRAARGRAVLRRQRGLDERSARALILQGMAGAAAGALRSTTRSC
jgi:hypothetical protein